MKALKPFSKKKPQADILETWPSPWLDSSIPWPPDPLINAPVVDVSEDDKEVSVKAEIPGLSPKDLELSYANGQLYLKGEKKEEKEERRKNIWHRESWEGAFARTIPIGREVDWTKASAKHKNGVLTVTLPKTGDRKSGQSIEIQ